MTTTNTTPDATLPPEADLSEAGWYAVQCAGVRREQTADEPYAPRPERYIDVPGREVVDIDITDALKAIMADSGFRGERTTAKIVNLIIEDGAVIARYEMQATE